MGRHCFILLLILIALTPCCFGQDRLLQIELNIYQKCRELKDSNDFKVNIDKTDEYNPSGTGEFLEDKGIFLFRDVMLYRAEPIQIRIIKGYKKMIVLLQPPNLVRNDKYGFPYTFYKLNIRFREGFFKITEFLREENEMWGMIWKNKRLRKQRNRTEQLLVSAVRSRPTPQNEGRSNVGFSNTQDTLSKAQCHICFLYYQAPFCNRLSRHFLVRKNWYRIQWYFHSHAEHPGPIPVNRFPSDNILC